METSKHKKTQAALERIGEYLRQNDDSVDERIQLARFLVFGRAALPMAEGTPRETDKSPVNPAESD